ncbi:hypothetical protein [Sphaerisporangium sp. TRM90804]|uniref:hypothetical protein n=1 Tax=Sphaerisporangium sp. TRM90804 TaxID=3031113 RepID=UPI00244C74D5|nr:hypothetical protein [Sphaerisporangium sp. TRM90804]MDH2429895.1 hypothetical protein [Sphaerisporangium sp. TRM90804]
MDPTTRSRSAATSAVVALLVTAVAACGAPGTAGGPAPAPPGGGSSLPEKPRTPGQPELALMASQIDAYLRESRPGEYAGIALDPAGGSLIVYRRESAGLDAALRQRFPGAPVEPRDAPHSLRELDALAETVRDDIPYWQERGVPITSVAARVDGTAVEVGTRDVARASAELPRRYGSSAPIDVVDADPALPTPPR